MSEITITNLAAKAKNGSRTIILGNHMYTVLLCSLKCTNLTYVKPKMNVLFT